MEDYRSTGPQIHSLSGILGRGDFLSQSDIEFQRVQFNPEIAGPGDLLVVGLDDGQWEIEAIDRAVSNGIAGVVTEQMLPIDSLQCIVDDAREAYAKICFAMNGEPSKRLLTIGVLGTHGKTTAAVAIAKVLKKVTGVVAYRTSLGVSDSQSPDYDLSQNPNAKELAKWLNAAQSNHAVAAVIEMSDQMLLGRAMSGIEFDVIVVPSLRKSQNCTQAERRSVEASLDRNLSMLCEHGVVVYNADDARLSRFVARRNLKAISYGMDADADIHARRSNQGPGENRLMVTAGSCVSPLDSTLEGDHNARHLLAAITTGYAFGLELHEVVSAAEDMRPLPGRNEKIFAGQDFPVIVDLADQPDRLAVTLHSMSKHHGNPTVCIAEVPERMSAEQRADYGRVLARAASRVILTTTRNDSTDGQKIAWEVIDGCEDPSAIEFIPNREAAIRFAIESRGDGESILLAGLGEGVWHSSKGWESDAEVVSRTLQEISTSKPAASNMAALAPHSVNSATGQASPRNTLRIFRAAE